MIDHVGSFSFSDRLHRAESRAGRADGGAEFENLLRGAGDSDTTSRPSPTRSTERPSRSGGTRLLDAPTAAVGNAPENSGTTAATTTESAGATETPEAPAPGKPVTRPAPAGFTKTTDTTAPHLPRYRDVPESAKFPLGPYQKAPQEYGGDWWLVSPFTGPEPWLALSATNGSSQAALETEPVPAGFEKVFGPRPDHGAAAAQWDQDLSNFQGTGLPEGFNEEQLAAAKTEFEAWGLGEPVFYQGRYGWQVRFPDSPLSTFETTASTALLTPHLVIAEYQVRSIQEGIDLGRYHPWLPERLRA